MNLKKRMICTVSALAMCISMAPAAFAAMPATETNLLSGYQLDEDELPLIDENGNIVDLNAPSIDLDVKEAHLQIGETTRIKATVSNSKDKIKWTSSDPQIATVNQNGVVTAVSVGESMITASITDCNLSVDIVVEEALAPDINITIANPNLKVGETTTATAEILNSDAKKVVWSSTDETMATIDQNGVITALKAGIVSIYAEIPGAEPVAAPVIITGEAKPVPQPSIRLSSERLDLLAGSSATLIPTVENADASAVVWSTSDHTVAAVKDGKVTAVAEGTAHIEARVGNVSASCTVYVYPVPVPSIDLDVEEAHLQIGETTRIKATVSNSRDEVKWTSSDPQIATVDQNGVVTAVSVGETMVTASITDCNLSVDIVVEEAPAPDINITIANPNLKVGETTTATAEILNSNAKKVVWSSADETLATIDQNGVITALKAGTVSIYAEIPGAEPVAAPVIITGEAKPEEKPVETTISLSASSLDLTEGDTAALTATVNPADQAVVWTSDNPAVATVTNGNVVAVAEGTAVITATADGKSASCTVTVTAKPVPPVPPVVEGTWNAETVYHGGEQVTCNGITFVAQWWNRNEKPDAANPWGAWKVVGDNNDDSQTPPSDGSWVAGTVYQGGEQVVHNGHTFVAQWWTQNEEPDAANQWGAWKLIG